MSRFSIPPIRQNHSHIVLIHPSDSCQGRPRTDNHRKPLTFLKGYDMETLTVEPEFKPLIHIDAYAAREGISRRTANRYAQQGRVTIEKVKGRTMIVDIPIAKRRIEPTQESPATPDMPKTSHLARTPDNYLFRLGELTALARTRRAWQALAIVLLVLLFISSPVMVWLYMSWRNALEALRA